MSLDFDLDDEANMIDYRNDIHSLDDFDDAFAEQRRQEDARIAKLARDLEAAYNADIVDMDEER